MGTLKRLCLFMVLLFLILILVFLILNERTVISEPKPIVAIFTILLSGLLPIIIAFLAAKEYLMSNRLNFLFMGCGIFVFAVGSCVGTWILFTPFGANAAVTIHNSSALCAAIFQLTAAMWEDTDNRLSPLSKRRTILTTFAAVSCALLVILSITSINNVIPPFFNANGPTELRQLILWSTILVYFSASMLFLKQYLKNRSAQTFWYFLSLLTFSICFFAFISQQKVGEPIAWIGRITMYLGGVFAFLSISAVFKSSKQRKYSASSIINEFFFDAENNYKSLVETSSNAIISVDQEFKVFSINSAAEKMFGCRKDEFINVSFLDTCMQDHWAKIIREDFEDFINFGTSNLMKTVTQMESKSNERRIFPIEISVSIRRLSMGYVSTYIIRDITERNRAEEELRISEKRIGEILNSIQDGFFELDQEYRYTYINGKAARNSNLKPEDYIGNCIWDLFPYAKETQFETVYREVMETRIAAHFEIQSPRMEQYYSIHVYPSAAGISVFWTDITERKMTEALRESEKELRVSSENLAAEVDSLRILHRIDTSFIQQEDIHSLYKDVLNAAIKITNADCGDMQIADENDRLLMIAHMGFGEAFVDYYQIVEGVHTTCGMAVREKRRVITEDIANCPAFIGTPGLKIQQDEGIVCIQSTPMFSSTGNLLGMLSTHYKYRHEFSDRELRMLDLLARQVADVIQRITSEEALRESEKKANKLVEELEKADKNKNQFISVLSLELRNPLAVISAGIQLLEAAQDINQAVKVNEIINRQTNQLCKLVDDLLELTRITQNKIKLKKEDINLNEIVKIAAEDIRLEYEKKGVKLGTKIQTKPVLLSADPVRITQAVGNILFNALKFTQAGGTVWLTLNTEKNNAVISVKDNGIGISPEILPQLFKPFAQADNTLERGNGGLGLGLSIVKGIVDLHDGSVSAYSSGLGKGSEFTICLPIKAEDDFMMEKLKPDNNGRKSLKLLVIEDNKDFADLLSTMLYTAGYTVDVAYDGAQGIKLAKQIKPDVIFCDIGLPGMSGYDVAKSIRVDTKLKYTHLIALTGYAGEGDAERAIKAGFNKHLAKPVNMETLKNVL